MLNDKQIEKTVELIKLAEAEGSEAVECIWVHFNYEFKFMRDSLKIKSSKPVGKNLKKLLSYCKDFSDIEKALCLQAFFVGKKDGKYPCNLSSLSPCFKCGGKIFASAEGNDRKYECLECGEVWEFPNTGQGLSDCFLNMMIRDKLTMDDLKGDCVE